MRQLNIEGGRVRLHTLEDIRRTVTPAALDKATLYQRRRRAFITDMADDGTRIEGRVQGTQRRPYTVTIELGIRPDGKVSIDGSCSCPVGFNCKHVAALLIESMAATPEGRKLAPSAGGPVLSPQAESWLADLDRAMALSDDEYPASIRQRLIYLLSITDGVASGPPQPVLELKSVRLLKDDTFSGTVSNYDPQSAFSSTPAKFLRGIRFCGACCTCAGFTAMAAAAVTRCPARPAPKRSNSFSPLAAVAGSRSTGR